MLTLGGFEDYPTRLLAPLSILFFYYYLNTKQIKYILPVFATFLLNLLFLQRQEVLNVVLGCLLLYLFIRRVRIASIVLYVLFGLVSVYLLVGVAAVLRFGSEQLSANIDIMLLPLWVVHADITSAYIFGQSVLENLNGNWLFGKYSFGSFISIVIPDYSEHGAEYIRKYFTDKETAQSIGVPIFVLFGFWLLFACYLIFH